MPGSKTLRREKTERRRTEIVDAAARLFARNGYSNTGIAELCDEVGLGRGALYHHIGSKEQLLVWIHDRVMDEVMSKSLEVVAQDLRPDLRLRALGEELIDIIVRFPDHVWVFLHEWRSLTGENAEEFRSRRREYEALVEGALRDGMSAQIFKIDDVRLTVLAWLGMHNYLYQWYRRPGRFDSQSIAKGFADIFLEGISVSRPVQE